MNRTHALKLIAKYNNDAAGNWDRYVVPTYRHLPALLLSRVRVRDDCVALDVGTGTGVAALALSGLLKRPSIILGIDIALRGLLIAQDKSSASRSAPKHHFACMDSTNMGFPNETFSLIIANFGIPEWERENCFNEIYRVMKTNGTLAFTEIARVGWLSERLPALVSNYLSESKAGVPQITTLNHWLKKRVVTATPYEMRSLLEKTGYRRVRLFRQMFEHRYNSVSSLVDHYLSTGLRYAQYQLLSSAKRRRLIQEVRDDLRRNSSQKKGHLTFRRYAFLFYAKKQ